MTRERLSGITSQVARVQQVLLLASLLSVVAWVWTLRADTTLAAWGIAAPMGLLCGVLALQFMLSVAVSRSANRPVRWSLAMGRAVLAEMVIAVRVFGWRQPWAWRRWADTLPAMPSDSGEARRGLVLVHGFMCNRGLWNAWQQALRDSGHAVVAVNLEPFRGSIDEYVQIIDRAVVAVTQASGGIPPLVVAHSMGGLAARAWLRAVPSARQRVAHVVTIGTPHRGTWLARWGLAVNARQMRLDSPWLRNLAAQEPADLGSLFTCWHSCADNIVFPLGTAVLPGSEERYLPHVGHVALVDHPAVFADVCARLNAPAAGRMDTGHR